MVVTPRFFPGLFKIELQYELAGRPWNIIQWGITSAPPPYSSSELTHLATVWQTDWAPIAAFTTTDNTIVGTRCTDFGEDTGLSEFVSAGGTGTETPPTLPVQCAAEISWKINRRYRGGHPKSFLSAIAEARQTLNRQFTSGFTTALDSAVGTFLGNINGETVVRGASSYLVNMVNRSLFSGGAERSTLLLDDVVGVGIQSIIASQRRRRGRA